MENKILLNVSYTDNTDKFWQDSYIKNKIFTLIDNDIHKTIAKAVEEVDGIELSYNAKPQSTLYIDKVDGTAVPTGYLYRGKSKIWNEGKRKYEQALFDVWVDIKSVSDYQIEELNPF